MHSRFVFCCRMFIFLVAVGLSVYGAEGERLDFLIKWDAIAISNSTILDKDSIASKKFERAGLEKQIQDDYTGAQIDFTKAIELHPTNYSALVNRAYTREIVGDVHGAILDYSKLIELNFELKSCYILRGFLKWGLKDYYGAIHDFSETLKIDPSNGEAFFYRGLIKHQLRGNDGGCADLKKSLELGFDVTAEEISRFCK
jgi:tetratricopeptide (TPR) repeat protein